MKLLLDENLPHALRQHIVGHDVYTVSYMDWSGTKNGELLSRAAAAGSDAILTMDSGVTNQQDLRHLQVAVVVLGPNRTT